MDGDFEPEGWSAFDDMGGKAKGNAGCGCFFLVLFLNGILVTLLRAFRGADGVSRKLAGTRQDLSATEGSNVDIVSSSAPT